MNTPATLATDPARALYDPVPETITRARALAERQLAVLERLAEAGVQVALAAQREAQARSPQVSSSPESSSPACAAEAPAPEPAQADAPGSLQGLAMAYARAARAVRMTVLLQSRVLRELESVERQAQFNAPAEAARREAARHAASEARKATIEHIVRRVAARQSFEDQACDDRCAGAEALQALVLDVADRLDDHDVYGDVLTRPIGETVARICADLGLDPDWSRLAREAWAETEIMSGAAGSPFTAARGAVREARDWPPHGPAAFADSS